MVPKYEIVCEKNSTHPDGVYYIYRRVYVTYRSFLLSRPKGHYVDDGCVGTAWTLEEAKELIEQIKTDWLKRQELSKGFGTTVVYSELDE